MNLKYKYFLQPFSFRKEQTGNMEIYFLRDNSQLASSVSVYFLSRILAVVFLYHLFQGF